MTQYRYFRATLAVAAFFSFSPLVLGGETETHWAYQSVVKPSLPDGYRDGDAIDFFLNREFESERISPAPRADRHTLLRRLTINLTGLPPTPKEIESFISDRSPDAYEKLVDRLLASPHYGERWGRHWLDVARYVQGKVKVPGVDRIDLATDYRDYVVRSFNEDKPYDRFILEQLAGDLLRGDDSDYFDRKIAPAFLSIGPWFDECTDPNKLKLDIVDEQISTLTKAFLAHDFACARCHDHKSDPIPTRDYYAMAGIFRSTRIISDFSEFWKDGRPRLTQPLAQPEEIARATTAQGRIDDLKKRRWNLLSEKRKAFLAENDAEFKKRAGDVEPQKQLKAWEAEDFSGYKNLQTVEGKYTPAIETRVPLDQWIQYDFHLNEAGNYLLYLRYASTTEAPVKLELNRKLREERIPISETGGKDYQHLRWEAFGPFPFKKGSNRIRLMADRHEPFPKLDALKIVKIETPQPTGSLDRALWRYSHSKTFWPPMVSEMELILPDDELSEVRTIDGEIAKLEKKARLERTLSVTDREELIEEPVRAGGNVYQIEGDPVPRAVPTLFSDIASSYPISDSQSGRVQLARWISDSKNALTARVMVNRLWHWHFGKGIVASTDNFGTRGAEPVNRDLLDWLAAEFIDSGWSIKHIQKLIVTSDAYQRSSRGSKELESCLLAKFPKRRLEAEALYDGLLGSQAWFPRQPSGSPLDYQLSRDRALYILVSARSPKGLGLEIRKMFDLFGFDPSGRPIHDRPDAVTPDQALWFLNNPLPKYYANQLADHILASEKLASRNIEKAFLRVLGHPPRSDQKRAAEIYLKQSLADGLSDKEALSRLILGLYSSDEFTCLY